MAAVSNSRADLLEDIMLADSVPIILSRQPNTARVAPELANKGYAATGKLWYIRPSKKRKGLIGWMPPISCVRPM